MQQNSFSFKQNGNLVLYCERRFARAFTPTAATSSLPAIFSNAEYHHDSGRLLDPQLHTHNVIVNFSEDREGHYKALQSRDMVRAIRLAGKVYWRQLARH